MRNKLLVLLYLVTINVHCATLEEVKWIIQESSEMRGKRHIDKERYEYVSKKRDELGYDVFPLIYEVLKEDYNLTHAMFALGRFIYVDGYNVASNLQTSVIYTIVITKIFYPYDLQAPMFSVKL